MTVHVAMIIISVFADFKLIVNGLPASDLLSVVTNYVHRHAQWDYLSLVCQIICLSDTVLPPTSACDMGTSLNICFLKKNFPV